MRYFVNSIISSVSNRLYCIVYLLNSTLKNRKVLHSRFTLEEIRIFLAFSKTQHTVITHANTSKDINISTFFEKVGIMLYLSNAPLKNKQTNRKNKQKKQTNKTKRDFYDILGNFVPPGEDIVCSSVFSNSVWRPYTLHTCSHCVVGVIN